MDEHTWWNCTWKPSENLLSIYAENWIWCFRHRI